MPTQTNLVGPWGILIQSLPEEMYNIVLVDQTVQDAIIIPMNREGMEKHIADCQEALTGVIQPPKPGLVLPR